MFNVAAFGNPLLDITVNVSVEFLKEHNLKEDDEMETTASRINLLYSDIKKYPSTITPGGCALNTARVLHWLLKKPNSIIYFGAIGNDEQGQTLTELVKNSGVITKYLIHDNYSTGTCIALVNGINRCLVAHLGAAEDYSFDAVNDSLDILKTVNLCYMEGFFLIKRLEICQYILDFCVSNKTIFGFNLCGLYICDMYPKEIEEFAKKCNILFGNRAEFSKLGEILSIEDPENVAIMLNQTFERKEDTLLSFGKIVVVTDAQNDIFCIHSDATVVKYTPPIIPLKDIKDTVGAGDSFVSGFVAALSMDFDIEKCIKYGCWTAQQLMRQVGCTVPDFVPNEEIILN